MKTYEVYFELFGKKMKTTVSASSKEHAKEVIKNKIKFNEIMELDLRGELPDCFKSIFGDKI